MHAAKHAGVKDLIERLREPAVGAHRVGQACDVAVNREVEAVCAKRKLRSAHAYAKAGKKDEALSVLDDLRELSKHRYVSSYEIAAIYVALGEREQAFQWLEKSYRERCFHLVYLKVWPEFDSLRSEPRFQDLLRRVGLLSL